MGLKVKHWIFSETIVVFDIRVGRCSQPNEYMKLYEYQKSMSFIDLHTWSFRFNMFKLLFLRNPLADWSQISCGASMGWGMKVRIVGLCHMTRMVTMSIYGKNLKKSSQEPEGRWPWNMVCGIGYSGTAKFVQMMTLGWPWSILQQFKFDHLCLCMGKCLSCRFPRNYWSLWGECRCTYSKINEYMMIVWILIEICLQIS